MTIQFTHSKNRRSLRGPQALLPHLFAQTKPTSLIDVGCGTGEWARTAMDLGVQDVIGLDGVQVQTDQLLIPKENFLVRDFTGDWNLERRFGMALCLEVAEHLEYRFASHFVRNLCVHSNTVVFSAACPGQEGQHHVNCQWPQFWQELFNGEGFHCDDSIRWKIWDDCRIEPWYRQNVFIATQQPEEAGQEKRIAPVIHPEFLYGTGYKNIQNARFANMTAINGGGMTITWYLRTPVIGLWAKLANRMRPAS